MSTLQAHAEFLLTRNETAAPARSFSFVLSVSDTGSSLCLGARALDEVLLSCLLVKGPKSSLASKSISL